MSAPVRAADAPGPSGSPAARGASWRFLWQSALKDIKRQIHDPLAIAMWIGIPVAIATLVYLAFGRTDAPPRAQLLVVNQDDSAVSQLFLGALNRVPVFDVATVKLEDGQARIQAGKASALLVIPAGFSTAVLEEKPLTLRLVTNPAQRILPGIIEETLQVLVDGSFYAQRVLGEPMRRMSADPPAGARVLPDTTIAGISIAINRIADRLGDYVFPPAIKLESEIESTEPAAGVGIGRLFFPSILFMSLLFMAQGLSGDIWQEATQGTLRRARTMPHPIGAFFAGKLVAAGLFIGGVCAIGLLVGASMFGLSFVRLPLAWLWATLTGVAFAALLALVQMFATSQRSANLLTTLLIFPLLMLGGSFFPFEAMPNWLARIGRLTPNGWALEQLKEILWGTLVPARLGVSFVALVGLALLAFALGSRRLGRGFAGGA